MRLFLIALPTYERGRELVRSLDGNDPGASIPPDDVVLLHRRPDGRVRVEQARDIALGRGMVGSTLQMLLALIAAPLIPSSSLRNGAAALIAAARERGMTYSMMQTACRCIESSGAVVCMLTPADIPSTVGRQVADADISELTVRPEILDLAERMAVEDWRI